MPGTGACEVTEGLLPADDRKMTNADFRQLAKPTVKVKDGEIGKDQLAEDAFDSGNFKGQGYEMAHGDAPGNEPAYLQSEDYIQGIFTDGVGTVGSTNFTSDLGLFSAGDNGRLILGTGIPAGTTIAYVNGNTITLSSAFLIQYTDGVITGGVNLYSPTGQFTNADNGRTIVGDGIPAGTTVTYVDPAHVTLSQAATNAANVTFQINGRPTSPITFTVVGRGKGWKVSVDGNGNGTGEIYIGVIAAQLARGTFAVRSDGSLQIGTGVTMMRATPSGDFIWGNGASAVGILHDGSLYVGAAAFADAIAQFASSGNFTLKDLPTSMHAIDPGCLIPTLAPVIASPAGGAITNPTNVSLNCLTKYSRIYYRLTQSNGSTTNASPNFQSVGAGFTVRDIGKFVQIPNVPAGTYIKSVTDGDNVVLSANATATAANLAWGITPDQTDTLYIDGAPIAMTATRTLSTRAYKNGEYSTLLQLLFSVDATTVPNPIFNPVAGTYGGSSLPETLSDALAGSSIRYNMTFSASGVPADPTDPSDVVGTLISPANGATPPNAQLNLAKGTTKIKAIGFKAGLNNSGVVSATIVVTGGSGLGGGGGGAGGGGGHYAP